MLGRRSTGLRLGPSFTGPTLVVDLPSEGRFAQAEM